MSTSCKTCASDITCPAGTTLNGSNSTNASCTDSTAITDCCVAEQNNDSLKTDEYTRIILTYCMSILVSGMLVLSNYNAKYKTTITLVIIISLVYFLCCALFDYFWINSSLFGTKGRSDTSNDDNRKPFHKFLHIINIS